MAFDDGVKTVSGSVAHTDDAATKVPFVSVKCGIEPTLTGVSEVTETQTGRNLLDFSAFSDYSNWKTDITETQSYPTANANRGILLDLPQGTYAVSFGIDAETYPTYLYLCKDDGSASTRLIYFSGANFSTASGTFTVDGTSKYYFRLGYTGSEANFNSQIAKIAWGQIELGSTATTYEPYTTPTQYTASLGRTIYGGQADIVNGEGQEVVEKITVSAFTGTFGAVNNGYAYYISVAGTTHKISVVNPTMMIANQLFTYGSASRGNAPTWQYGGNDGVDTAHIFILPSEYDTLTKANNFLSSLETPLEVTLTLATPTDFTFPPITPTPETVGKVNNVYCNTGNTELTYYDNAHGFAEVTVNKTGKNLWSSDKDLSITRDKTMYMRIPRGTYTLSFDFVSSTASPVPSYMQVAYSTTDGTKYNPVTVVEGRCSRTFTLSADARALTIYSSTSYSASVGVTTVVNNIQLEVGSQASSYEPYEAVSKTAYLHKVIYGGTADVVKGTCEPKNLIPFEPISEYTYLGITYTQYSDGTVKINGTASGGLSFYRVIPNGSDGVHFKSGVAYTLSGCVGGSSTTYQLDLRVGNSVVGYYKNAIDYGRGYTFTATEDSVAYPLICVRNGTTVNNVIISPMVEVGSSVSEYAPYFEPFSFPPISISTDEGENTLFANEGDSAITYRKAVD